MNRPKKIVLLGSTGSIGRSALEVIEHLGPERFEVEALATNSNVELLSEQIERFCPRVVAVMNSDKALWLKARHPRLSLLTGQEGMAELAKLQGTLVLVAISGTAGVLPTLRAIEAGNDVALANKEALVSAGELIMKSARAGQVRLLPIDSEHSAIFQCLDGTPRDQIKRLILTASGGPFLHYREEQLQTISAKEALCHPTWQMGAKITVDSSTLMNKGLEVIEAHHLFSLPPESIEVLIHPQSIIHSFVEFIDHSTLAQLSHPDMKLPIQYALTYPERLPALQRPLDLAKIGQLQFCPPDMERFCCLRLAYEALRAGKSYCCFLNAANEELVSKFLKREISWLAIGEGLKKLMDVHTPQKLSTLEAVFAVEEEARRLIGSYIVRQAN